MNMKKTALSIAIASLMLPALSQAKTLGTLESVKKTGDIQLDGSIDDTWNKAPALKVKVDKNPYKPSNGFKGVTKSNMTIKSMYDDNNIYFLVQWDDPTKSLNRFPWMKQSDGTWKQSKNKDSSGHDNTYYEDKMAFLWNINYAKFSKKGCEAVCHLAKNGKNNGFEDKSPGRKYTKDGATIDMWHWKGVRTNPVGMIDDQFIDDKATPESHGWGRHGDAKTGGGYKNNIDKATGQPAFVQDDLTNDSPAIFEATKYPFNKDYDASNRIPGIVISKLKGSRGDIHAKGIWKDGKWTVELMRPLVTKGDKVDKQDVQFNDKSKAYEFGVAIFDNTQINHTYHKGVYHMVFK